MSDEGETMSDEATLRLTLASYDLQWMCSGGMSEVYRGSHRISGQAVVVKMVDAAHREHVTALIREREALVRLDHPSIVRTLDWIDEAGRVGLVLEAIDGPDLAQVIKARDLALNEPRVRDWACQLARALDYLHSQRPAVLFRDLKPANVLLGRDERLVLIDFGTARVKVDQRPDTVALGTPGYAAPEQYGAATSDERSDVYALGVTMFELLSGRDPSELRFDFPPLRSLGVEVSPELEAIVGKAVHPEPAKRYASARALLQDLEGGLLERFAHATRSPWMMPAAVLAGAATPALVATSSGWDGWLYPVSLLAFLGGSCSAGARQRSSTAMPRSGSWLLVALTAVLWVGIIAALPLATLQAALRRMALELGALQIPVGGHPYAWAGVGLACVLWGHLVGCAALRRRPSLVAAGTLVFALGLAVHTMQAALQRDQASPSLVNYTQQWAVVPQVAQLFDAPRVENHAAGWRGLLARGWYGDFAVYDMKDGRLCWKGHAPSARQVEPGWECVMSSDGPTLKAQDPATGTVMWTLQAQASIRRFEREGRQVYLLLANDAIECIDAESHMSRWVWQGKRTGLEMSTGEGLVVGQYRRPESMTALDPATGKELWTKTLSLDSGCRLTHMGSSWYFLTADRVSTLNPATGDMTVLAQVPAGAQRGGFDRPMEFRPLDAQHALGLAGRWLMGIPLQGQGEGFCVRLPAEGFSLQDCGPRKVCLISQTGRVLGIEPQHGGVTWEYWSRTARRRSPLRLAGAGPAPQEHVWSFARSVGDYLYAEEQGSGDVLCIDPVQGKSRYRMAGLPGIWQWTDDQDHQVILQAETGKWPRLVSIKYSSGS